MDAYDLSIMERAADRLGMWLAVGMLAAGTVVAVALIVTHGVV
jgi:hypothetical protein